MLQTLALLRRSVDSASAAKATEPEDRGGETEFELRLA